MKNLGKTDKSETIFLSSLLYKESFCSLYFCLRLFENGKNKTLRKYYTRGDRYIYTHIEGYFDL